MSRSQVFKLISASVGISVLVNLCYLPGPSFLHGFSIFSYLLGFIVSVLVLFIFPVVVAFAYHDYSRNKRIIKNNFVFIIVCVLPIVTLISIILSVFLKDINRDIAIHRVSSFINEIENYHDRYGSYPSELTIKKPSPGIIGIQSYHYKKTGDTYFIEFSQIEDVSSEIVVYDKSNTAKISGDAPEMLETGFKNWKYYSYID